MACAERDPLHQGIIVERAKLKQREFQLDLTSRLGKSQVITNTTPLNQQVPCAAPWFSPVLPASRPSACLHHCQEILSRFRSAAV
jgi:hypothetical protein